MWLLCGTKVRCLCELTPHTHGLLRGRCYEPGKWLVQVKVLYLQLNGEGAHYRCEMGQIMSLAGLPACRTLLPPLPSLPLWPARLQ